MENQNSNVTYFKAGKPISAEPVKAPSPVVEKPLFRHQPLLDALYFFNDTAERCTVELFLIGDVAKQVVANEHLSLSQVDFGVRRNEWVSGGRNLFDDFIDHERIEVKEDGDLITYMYQEIPVVLHVLDDNPTTQSFDTVFYMYETFKIPNPL